MWTRLKALNSNHILCTVTTLGLVLLGLGLQTQVLAATDPYSLSPRSSVYDVQTLLNLAEQGDKRAAFLLGTRYAAGQETTRDDSEALRWFTLAAQAGLAEAQYNLGIMYAQGRGVPRNLKTAADWYTRAAQQGLAMAQYNLGTLYSSGGGIRRDETKAAEWMERAARKGIAPAQFNLAIFYEYGRGVRLNASQALYWYRQAEELGFNKATARRLRLEQLLDSPTTAQTPEAGAVSETEAPQKTDNKVEEPIESSQAMDQSAQSAESATALQNTGDEWLESLDSDHYTLQLASFVDRKAAEEFIRKAKITTQIGIYASVKKGKRWYSVVYGDYPSYKKAQTSARKLPASLRSIKPWVRKASLIKKEQE